MGNNEDRGNREKKGREIWYFNFKPRNWILKFSQSYSIHNFLWQSKVLLLDVKISSLPQHKKFTNLWHLWRSIYEVKLIMYWSSHLEVFCKKDVLKKYSYMFLENLQNTQEITCVEVSFSIKLHTSTM